MYIVTFGDHKGTFGPFDSLIAANEYIAECGARGGKVIELIKPWALARPLVRGIDFLDLWTHKV